MQRGAAKNGAHKKREIKEWGATYLFILLKKSREETIIYPGHFLPAAPFIIFYLELGCFLRTPYILSRLFALPHAAAAYLYELFNIYCAPLKLILYGRRWLNSVAQGIIAAQHATDQSNNHIYYCLS